MIAALFALTALTIAIPEVSCDDWNVEMGLSQHERDRIWKEIHFAIKKMNYFLDRAHAEASQITDINCRNAMVGAIEGAVAGIGGGTAYSVVIFGCLGAIARISGDAYLHFAQSRDYVKESKCYAEIADTLEERLWRDE